jgi:hypothetical protein
MFLESPDDRGAGVGYRCGEINGQKTRDLPGVAGLLRPCDHRSSMKAALEVALDLGS